MTQLMDEQTVTRARTWREDWPLAVAAAVAGTIDWVMATQAAGVDLTVGSGSGSREVGVVSVIVTAIVVTLAAGALLRFAESRSPRGLTIWTAVAGAVFVASLTGPLGATTLQAGLWLISLHAVVASVVVGGLRRRACA